MPRAILFGYEGGLVGAVGPRFEVLSAVLAEEGLGLSAEILETCRFGPPYEGWLTAVIGRLRAGSEAELPARLMARAAARYHALLKVRGPAWLDGAVDFVERTAAAGLPLGVVASLPRPEVLQALSDAGLAKCFRVVVTADDLDGAASFVDAYRLALGRLNTEPPLPERLMHPHEVAAIEGAPQGVRAAAAAGLMTIVVGSDLFEPEPADFAVGGFAELDLRRLDSG